MCPHNFMHTSHSVINIFWPYIEVHVHLWQTLFYPNKWRYLYQRFSHYDVKRHKGLFRMGQKIVYLLQIYIIFEMASMIDLNNKVNEVSKRDSSNLM